MAIKRDELDYETLEGLLERARVQIMSIRAYMQFGAFQGITAERFEKFRQDFDELLTNIATRK
jgi:hypothetical protein